MDSGYYAPSCRMHASHVLRPVARPFGEFAIASFVKYNRKYPDADEIAALVSIPWLLGIVPLCRRPPHPESTRKSPHIRIFSAGRYRHELYISGRFALNFQCHRHQCSPTTRVDILQILLPCQVLHVNDRTQPSAHAIDTMSGILD